MVPGKQSHVNTLRVSSSSESWSYANASSRWQPFVKPSHGAILTPLAGPAKRAQRVEKKKVILLPTGHRSAKSC